MTRIRYTMPARLVEEGVRGRPFRLDGADGVDGVEGGCGAA